MNPRGRASRTVSAATLPTVVVLGSNSVQADNESEKEFVGAWTTIHTLPFPPGSFREFLSLADGGAVHETNSFLHTSSYLDLRPLGIQRAGVNASDGIGSWDRVGKGQIRVTFRKFLFDEFAANFGDVRVTGNLRTDGVKLWADWHIDLVTTENVVLKDLGKATSEGTRIG
jgi:hypothetical protein